MPHPLSDVRWRTPPLGLFTATSKETSLSSKPVGTIALAIIAAAMLAVVPAKAQESWEGQTFLTDYSKLQERPTTEGKDYVYLSPDFENVIGPKLVTQ